MREHSGFPDNGRNRYRFRSEFVGHQEKSGRNIEQSTVNFQRRTTGERSSSKGQTISTEYTSNDLYLALDLLYRRSIVA